MNDKIVKFEAYSAVAFVDAIRSSSCYDELTLLRVLKAACG